MSIYECNNCGKFLNARDGCYPDPHDENKLICTECKEAIENEKRFNHEEG